MKINKISFEEIIDILDISVCENKSFAISCFGNLAQDIQSYLSEMYGIEDIDSEEIDEDEEYFVSSLPSDDNEEYMVFIESIYGNIDIKQFECDCEMMIFNEFDLEEVEKYIEARSIGYYEFESDDDFEDCNGNCDGCCGCDDDFEDEEEDFYECLDCTIERYTKMILKTDGCENCIEDILKDFVCTIFEKIKD